MPSSRVLDSIWKFCVDKVPRQEVVFVCQIGLSASFTAVIVALLNRSLSDRDKELWSTLVEAGI